MELVGVALRNYKCYSSTEVVPLFYNGEKYVGLIGENGVGKSAVFQALCTFFNGREWIRNKVSKAGANACGVAPIVYYSDESDLPKSQFPPEELKLLRKNSQAIKKNLKSIAQRHDGIYLSCMLTQDDTIGLFDGRQTVELDSELARKIRNHIKTSIKYVHISAEEDIDDSASINSDTTELIKGSGVVGEIARVLKTVDIGGKGIASVINDTVMAYLKDDVIKKLQEVDPEYNYKNLRQGAQSRLSEKNLSELATQALFGNRELTKRANGRDIGLSEMSSGQRRRAFLDFIIVMINNLEPKERAKVILSIDEPEISVDAGSRIQQFDKLRDLAKSGVNVAFTTHWYGWITQLTGGNAILIKESEEGRRIIPNSVELFLEDDTQQKVPYEMRMMFDFLSSLGAWAETDNGKKFVLCEGITDYSYLTKHFDKYKIIPLRGRDEVVRLYKIFSDYYFRFDKKPDNIIFLIDTDPEKDKVAVDKFKNLRRISRNTSGAVELCSNNDNYSEKCAIEDTLCPRPFLEAIKQAAASSTEEIDATFVDGLAIKYSQELGSRAFGIDEVEKQKLKALLKTNGIKKTVAELYAPTSDEINAFKQIFNF